MLINRPWKESPGERENFGSEGNIFEKENRVRKRRI